MTFRCQRFQLGNESPVVVEQLLRLITAHPLFQHLQVCRIGSNICYRDLVRAPVALEVVLAHLPRGRPTFRATEYDHWPSRPNSFPRTWRLLLDLADLQNTMLQRGSHRLVHPGRHTSLDKVRRVAIADEQRFQFLVTYTSQKSWVIDLVAVQMQDRQHRSVGDRIEKFVTMPAGGERAGFSLAVTHHYQSDKVWVVVNGPVSVRDAIAQFTALVNASGRFRSGVAADSAGERKLLKEALHPSQVLALVRVNLRIRSLEIGLGKDSWRTVARPRD